jgi:hypothetical protein
VVGICHRFPTAIICRAELRIVARRSALAAATAFTAAQKLSKELAVRPCGTQRAIHHCCAVKGLPARPQYPMRGARGSLLSQRHIMQPEPWHRKKWLLIW